MLPSSEGHTTVGGAAPALTGEVRYRMSAQQLVSADGSGARGLGSDPVTVQVATKVGPEWKLARSSLARSACNDPCMRLSPKSRRDGPALYLRNTF